MLGALIGAAASLGSSFLSSKASDKANQAALEQARQQEATQREFAQSGIQWKVADAKKAGVHPLYALGANTTSYSPVTVGQSTPDYSGLAEAGQNIGSAVSRTMDPATRQITSLQLERAALENDLLRSQIRQTNSQTTGIPAVSPFEALPGQNVPLYDPEMFNIPGQRDSSFVPSHHDYRKPQFTTNLRMAGKDIAPSPAWSDAQTMEDRYGEISDYVYGPAVAIADWYRNVKPYLNRQLYDKLRR